jgi:fumarate hydratase class II
VEINAGSVTIKMIDEVIAGGTRTETDSMGAIAVQNHRYWGAQTQRSLIYFAIGHDTMPRELIRAFGVLKRAAATVNQTLGKLPDDIAHLIIRSFSVKCMADRERYSDEYECQ